MDMTVLEFVSAFIFPQSISFGKHGGTQRGENVYLPMLKGAQCHPELAFRTTDFCVPKNLIFPALISNSMIFGKTNFLK